MRKFLAAAPELHAVADPTIEVDFGRTYGERFAFLTGLRPYSILFAKGSEVTVYKGTAIH